jgi:hypothetical protein
MLGRNWTVLQHDNVGNKHQQHRGAVGVRRWSTGSNSNTSRSSNTKASSVPIEAASPDSVSDQAAYDSHCRILEAGAVLCRAEIAVLPGGARGMVAKQRILPGQSVLECAAANILAVPKTAAAVEGWQRWLQLYTSAHGPLPQQLTDFLAGAWCRQRCPHVRNQSCRPALLPAAMDQCRSTQGIAVVIHHRHVYC